MFSEAEFISPFPYDKRSKFQNMQIFLRTRGNREAIPGISKGIPLSTKKRLAFATVHKVIFPDRDNRYRNVVIDNEKKSIYCFLLILILVLVSCQNNRDYAIRIIKASKFPL